MIAEKISYDNRFSNIHPLPKIIFSFSLLFLTFWFSNIVNLLVIASIFLLCFLGKIKITDFLKFFLVIVLFIFLSSLTLFFDFSSLTIQRGLKVFVRSVAGTSCILFLIFTTPVVDIISFIHFRMLKDLIFLIYRAIYILLKVVEQMITAQTARFGYSNFRNTINSMKYLMYGAFSRSIKYSEESYMGLSSRNYNGTIEILKEYSLNLYILIPFVIEIALIALEVFYVKA